MYRFIKKTLSLIALLSLIFILFGCNTDKEYSPGYWDENTYIHKWANLKFELPEDFIKADKDLIKSYISNIPDAVVAEPGIDVSNATSIIEFLATTDYQDYSSLKTIALVEDNINILDIKTEGEYIEYQKELAVSDGFEYFFSENYETKIGGKTFTYFDATVNSIGLNMVARTCFRFKDNYAIVIQIVVMGNSNSNDIDALLESFTKPE